MGKEVVFKGVGEGKFQYEITRIEKKEPNQYGAYFYTFKVFAGTYSYKGRDTKDFSIPSWQAKDAIRTIEQAEAKCRELEGSQTADEVTAAAQAATSEGPPV